MLKENDVIDALIKCTGYDSQHTPRASEIVIDAWMEHFEEYPGVTREDLLQAVREYHRTSHDSQIQPAHLSQIARKYGRDRIEQSGADSDERRRLEAVANAKAAEEPRAIVQRDASRPLREFVRTFGRMP